MPSPFAAARRRTALALVAAVLSVVAACGREDPERALRETIERMARAVEQREPSAFLGSVADDFTRESGAFGKQDAKRVLAGVYLRNEKVSVSAVVTEVRIDGDRAFARVRVLATGGAGLLPERGQAWEFDSAWRREGGDWKVFNAEWREGF